MHYIEELTFYIVTVFPFQINAVLFNFQFSKEKNVIIDDNHKCLLIIRSSCLSDLWRIMWHWRLE